MKTFLDYLREAQKKKQSQDSDSRPTKNREPDIKFDPFGDQNTDQPLSTRPSEPLDSPQTDPRRAVSQRDTQRAISRIEPSQQMRNLVSRMRNIDSDPEDTGYPAPEEPENLPSTRVNTANLPAVAGRALSAAGVQNPDFHKVSNLPGNMSRAIRTLGKQLFRSLTRTDTDDVFMIGNLNDQGPNTRQELSAVAAWVRGTGEDLGDGNIDFDTTIPGYSADIRQYSAAGIRWLLVRDEFGSYIYSWPESDSIQHRNTPRIANG
jgi:hypothetical protein